MSNINEEELMKQAQAMAGPGGDVNETFLRLKKAEEMKELAKNPGAMAALFCGGANGEANIAATPGQATSAYGSPEDFGNMLRSNPNIVKDLLHPTTPGGLEFLKQAFKVNPDVFADWSKENYEAAEKLVNSDPDILTKLSNIAGFPVKLVAPDPDADRKCPSCGGIMDFNPTLGALCCPFCGHEEDKPDAKSNTNQSAKELDFEAAEKKENCNWGAETKTVHCKSCGAEMIFDALEVASECPYCGSNQIMDASDKNTLAPGGVVPFAIDSDTASANFKKWIGKKFFCPKLAKESARPDAFNGIYLPYWTFDAQTESKYTAKVGKDRTVKNKDGSSKTVTDWSNTSGNYDAFFDDELVLGSDRHNTLMLKGIEPFNTAANKAYKAEYLAGFGAERYSIGLKSAWDSAKASIKYKLDSKITSKILSDHNANHVKDLNVKTVYSKLTYKYLMLPVWCSSFKYNGKVYQFMVNGQTGKVYGKTPVSGIKIILTCGIILLVLIALGVILRLLR